MFAVLPMLLEAMLTLQSSCSEMHPQLALLLPLLAAAQCRHRPAGVAARDAGERRVPSGHQHRGACGSAHREWAEPAAGRGGRCPRPQGHATRCGMRTHAHGLSNRMAVSCGGFCMHSMLRLGCQACSAAPVPAHVTGPCPCITSVLLPPLTHQAAVAPTWWPTPCPRPRRQGTSRCRTRRGTTPSNCRSCVRRAPTARWVKWG